MRGELEEIRDRIVQGMVLDLSRGGVLSLHDALTELIDKACEYEGSGLTVVENPPAIQLVPVNVVRDMLNECLSAALMPFPVSKPTRKATVRKTSGKKKSATKRKTSKRR